MIVDGKYIKMCGEMYGLTDSTTSIIVRKCGKAIKVLVKPFVFPKLIKERI